jgi:signal transduction histidine kinase/CheY-like chemotaxis protein
MSSAGDRHLRLESAAAGDQNGGTICRTAVTDITERKQADEKLKEAKTAAEEASRVKSEFLANMSHEIRTPLNGVLGMAALLHQSELTERQTKMVKTIEESGDELLDILNGILDLSRIESGRIELEEAPFDLDELLRRAAALFGPQAHEKGVEFRIDASPQAKGVFIGDGTRVRQVLYNLLSNAVKFTQKGEVTASADVVRRSEKAGSSLELVLTVRDTGIGVPADKLERIFHPFTQADGTTTRKFGGAGLGLTIASHLAELLGGSIVVRSDVDVGSTFTARLRVAPPPAADAAPELEEPSSIEAGPARPLRVLVAEDNATNQLVLQGLLAACGAEATVVDNGLKALEAWAAQKFDLILLDIQMPVMDGVAAAREIRELESRFGRARTPIVAASANAMTHQVESYLAAGMDGHLAKPIRPAAMVDALQRFAAPQAASRDDADAA